MLKIANKQLAKKLKRNCFGGKGGFLQVRFLVDKPQETHYKLLNKQLPMNPESGK